MSSSSTTQAPPTRWGEGHHHQPAGGHEVPRPVRGPRRAILFEALRTLRSLCVERDTLDLCERIAPEYARTVYNGLWFHPKREAMDALFANAMEPCTGDVTVELYKGRATPSRLQWRSLYRDLASFKMGDGYEPQDSEGFVRLFGLPGTVAAAGRGRTVSEPQLWEGASRRPARSSRAPTGASPSTGASSSMTCGSVAWARPGGCGGAHRRRTDQLVSRWRPSRRSSPRTTLLEASGQRTCTRSWRRSWFVG